MDDKTSFNYLFKIVEEDISLQDVYETQLQQLLGILPPMPASTKRCGEFLEMHSIHALTVKPTTYSEYYFPLLHAGLEIYS